MRPLAWRGEELAAHPPATRALRPEERAEVAALCAWLAPRRPAGAELYELLTSPEAPPTPHLRALAAALSAELRGGWGVALLTGLVEPSPQTPASRALDSLGDTSGDTSGDDLPIRVLFLRLGALLGPVITTYGHLYEVRDGGGSYQERAIPVSQTRAQTGMHTDSSGRGVWPELVGLACVRPALNGGASRLSSAAYAHELLRAAHPALLPLLYEDFIRDIVTPGASRDPERVRENRFPIFTREPFGVRYMRYWIERGHERAGEPLSAERLGALDALDAALGAPEALHRFMMRRGELLFLNNRLVVHDREEYEGCEDPARGRLMLRLWIGEEGA